MGRFKTRSTRSISLGTKSPCKRTRNSRAGMPTAQHLEHRFQAGFIHAELQFERAGFFRGHVLELAEHQKIARVGEIQMQALQFRRQVMIHAQIHFQRPALKKPAHGLGLMIDQIRRSFADGIDHTFIDQRGFFGRFGKVLGPGFREQIQLNPGRNGLQKRDFGEKPEPVDVPADLFRQRDAFQRFTKSNSESDVADAGLRKNIGSDGKHERVFSQWCIKIKFSSCSPQVTRNTRGRRRILPLLGEDSLPAKADSAETFPMANSLRFPAIANFSQALKPEPIPTRMAYCNFADRSSYNRTCERASSAGRT